MATIDAPNETIFLEPNIEWNPKSYRCHVCLIREDDGGFSATVLNLPGVGSCGDTEDEAMRNCREAISGALESYAKANETVPWLDPRSYEIPDGATDRWIVLDA